MPFAGNCNNRRALAFRASPTLADGVTPAPVDPNHPLRVVATDGSPLESAPHPDAPGNPLRCIAFVPDGFVGVVSCKSVLDADLDPDTGEGDPNYKEISDAGTIAFSDPEAANVGTAIDGEVDKPAPAQP